MLGCTFTTLVTRRYKCAYELFSYEMLLAGSAADQVVVHKSAKYALRPMTDMFVSITFETVGTVNVEGAEFIS